MDHLDQLHTEHRQAMYRCLMAQVRAGREILADAIRLQLPTEDLAAQLTAIAQLEKEASVYAD
jgi:hypothetical protein